MMVAFKGASKQAGGGGFNWGNAALGFFGGADVVAALQRHREAERERQQVAAQQAAAQALGFTKDEIAAMSPQALSWAAQQRIVSRGFGLGGDGAEGGEPGGGGGADGAFPPSDKGQQPAPGDFVALGMPGAAVPFQGPYRPAPPGFGKGLAPGFGVALGGALAGIPRASTPAQLAALAKGKFFIAPNGSIRKKI